MEEKPENQELKTLLIWRAPSRVFKVRDKEFYSTVIALAILASIVFFFVKEFLLVVVIWAGVLFTYALSNYPPEEVEHKITDHGLTTLGTFYPWEDLGPFWFSEKYQTIVLHVSARRQLLGELTLLLRNEDQDKIKDLLAKHLPYLENRQETWSDRASSWLSSKFSFEKTPKAV